MKRLYIDKASIESGFILMLYRCKAVLYRCIIDKKQVLTTQKYLVICSFHKTKLRAENY
jgi:hypothetical protein